MRQNYLKYRRFDVFNTKRTMEPIVSENNNNYENSDSNCDGRMREGVHSLWRVALMLLFSSMAINFRVSSFSYMGFTGY